MIIKTFDKNETEHVINENGYEYRPSDFQTTRGAKTHNVFKALPSLALTFLISPPLAALVGLGALHARLMNKWDAKYKFLEELDPRYWGEFIANPNSVKIANKLAKRRENWDNRWEERESKKDREEFDKKFNKAWKRAHPKDVSTDDDNSTILHRSNKGLTSQSSAGTGIAAAAATAAAIAATARHDDSSLHFDNGKMSAEEFMSSMKSKMCRPYYVKFRNGEVVRVHATDENTAKILVEYMLQKYTKLYDNMNDAIRAHHAAVYTVYFDDGEVMYWIGSGIDRSNDEYESICNNVYETKKTLTDAMNDLGDNTGIPIKKMEAPNIQEIFIQYKNRIEPASIDNIERIDTVPPRRSIPKESVPSKVYNIGQLAQYTIKVGDVFAFNVPAKSADFAAKLVKELTKTSQVKSMIDAAETKGGENYKVKTGDGDIYSIYYYDRTQAEKLALEIMDIKRKIIERYCPRPEVFSYFNVVERCKDKLFTVNVPDRPSKNESVRKVNDMKVYSYDGEGHGMLLMTIAA